MKRAAIATAVLLFAAIVIVLVARARSEQAFCGPGFVARGTRCCPPSEATQACGRPTSCPAPLVMGRAACAPPDERVFVPAAHLVIGAADWEAEGRVPTREVDVHAFYIDRFEVAEEGARARAGVTRDEAEAYCRARGGRLPTDDEWTAAAAGSAGRRYPWGDTGAVCRRAAWGLRTGPCASAPSSGPDTVGAHADGATPNGIHDLAGNVAEWVAASPSDPSRGIARGGSFRSTLAADLRTWAREEVDPAQRHPWVGFRCAYDSP